MSVHFGERGVAVRRPHLARWLDGDFGCVSSQWRPTKTGPAPVKGAGQSIACRRPAVLRLQAGSNRCGPGARGNDLGRSGYRGWRTRLGRTPREQRSRCGEEPCWQSEPERAGSQPGATRWRHSQIPGMHDAVRAVLLDTPRRRFRSFRVSASFARADPLGAEAGADLEPTVRGRWSD